MAPPTSVPTPLMAGPSRSNGGAGGGSRRTRLRQKSRLLKKEAKTELRDAKLQLRQNMKSGQWWRNIARLTVAVVCYFCASIGLTFFQKSLISHFPFPVTIVTFHFALKFCLAGFCRQLFTACTGGPDRVVLTWRNYLSRVALVAIFSALDIGLSQWSFEFITVSLYTMTKTTAVLFMLAFALLFKLEKKHWSLIVIVSMISLGLFLFVYRSTTFSVVGFSLALGASFTSGLRWSLSQMVMQKSKLGLENPVDMIYHIQPIMMFTLVPFAAGFEGLALSATEKAFRFHEYSTALYTAGLVLFGGSLGFVMEVIEFYIITKASSLTLSIVGIIKEIFTIMLDVMYNGSELSPINVVGVVICLAGIGIHVARKAATSADADSADVGGGASARRRRQLRRDRGAEFSLPLLSDDDDDDWSDWSSDDELFIPGGGGGHAIGGKKRRFKEFDEDFYLRDNREWTSVRDHHLSQPGLEEAADEGATPSVLLDTPDGGGEQKKAAEPPLLADIQLISD